MACSHDSGSRNVASSSVDCHSLAPLGSKSRSKVMALLIGRTDGWLRGSLCHSSTRAVNSSKTASTNDAGPFESASTQVLSIT